jgi:hypothetical protein
MIFPTPSWLPPSPLARKDSKPSAVPNRPPVAVGLTPIRTATAVSNLVAPSAPRKVNPYARKVLHTFETSIVVSPVATAAVAVRHVGDDASQHQHQQHQQQTVVPTEDEEANRRDCEDLYDGTGEDVLFLSMIEESEAEEVS